MDEILAQQKPPLDFQSFWTFDVNRTVTNSLTNETPGRWFFHDKDVPPILTTLRSLQGHRGYLIKMRSAGRLRLAGRPLVRSSQFTSRVSNLFGALSDSVSGILSFEEFFSHPNALGKVRASGPPVTHDIFAMVSDQFVRRTLTDAIRPNEAYWLNVVQDFEYSGPVDVTENLNGVSFGRSTLLRTLAIEVPSSQSARTVTLQARSCAVLSVDGECSAGGASVDWLEYRDLTKAFPNVWRSLSAGLAVVVPAGSTRIELELRARRASLESAARTLRGGDSGATFPAVIDVVDERGSRAVVSSDVTVEPIFGRWFGRATLTQVGAHPSVQKLPLEQAEASPMGMTLLLELPDPSVARGGSPPRLLDTVSLATFRDGRSFLRKFTSILFDRPVTLVADAADPLDPFGATGTLRGTLSIHAEDSLNPYRHRYNPEHRKGYEITREITIKIERQKDRLSDELAGLDGTFGPHRLAGQYTEVITGISESPNTVRGTFRLDRLLGEVVGQ